MESKTTAASALAATAELEGAVRELERLNAQATKTWAELNAECDKLVGQVLSEERARVDAEMRAAAAEAKSRRHRAWAAKIAGRALRLRRELRRVRGGK